MTDGQTDGRTDRRTDTGPWHIPREHRSRGKNQNKMAINPVKPVELVFHRPNIYRGFSPFAMPNVSRLASANLLGVYLRHDLNFSQHVESVIVNCSQRHFC